MASANPTTLSKSYAAVRQSDDASFNTTLLLVAGIILLLIVWVKSRTTAEFLTDPITVAYSIFVTTFQLSRLISALFYPTFSKAVTSSIPPSVIANYEPTVSFVVPCKNEEGAIRNTVEQCFAANYPKEKLEVIVINDGSTDRTGEILDELKQEYPRLIVVHWAKNRGKRHGMAEGFKRAAGEIVVQLDSDSYIDPQTFRNIIIPFANPKIGGVCAHADPQNADKNWLTRMQAAYYFMSFRILKAAESAYGMVFCCSGCSSAYRRSAVMPILDKWLNEQFLGLPVTWGDDRGITNWVLRQGYQTIYTDQTQAYTIVPENLNIFIKQQLRWKKGWFVNSIFASKFVIKKDPFVAFTYFFPLMFVTLMTPFMATRAFIYTPIVMGTSAVAYYLIGVLLVASIITVFYRIVSRNNRYWPYLLIWAAINMLILSFLLFFALAGIQNRKWSTR